MMILLLVIAKCNIFCLEKVPVYGRSHFRVTTQVSVLYGRTEVNSDTTIMNIVLASPLLNKAITCIHFRHHTDLKHTLL